MLWFVISLGFFYGLNRLLYTLFSIFSLFTSISFFVNCFFFFHFVRSFVLLLFRLLNFHLIFAYFKWSIVSWTLRLFLLFLLYFPPSHELFCQTLALNYSPIKIQVIKFSLLSNEFLFFNFNHLKKITFYFSYLFN